MCVALVKIILPALILEGSLIILMSMTKLLDDNLIHLFGYVGTFVIASVSLRLCKSSWKTLNSTEMESELRSTL
jgi:uncharacterized membrane protein YqgA involved in biofilm formation